MSAPENSTASVLALVASDMAEVDRVIADRLDSGVPLVGDVARYIISAGGKRLRPVLLLLTCGVHANVMRFLFPLTVPENVLDEGLAILDEALRAARA